MTLLTLAAIAILFLTAVMFAVEQYEQMRKSARQQLRRERGVR